MKRLPLVPIVIVLLLVVLGAALLFLKHDAAPAPGITSSTAPVTTGQPAAPSGGTKAPGKTTQTPPPSATSSTPAAPQTAYVAHLSIAPKNPSVNTAPPVATVTLTFALDSYVPQKKAMPHDDAFYTVEYGDGTSGAFKFDSVVAQSGSAKATEQWFAPDHTYQTPGTYTARALRSGVEIARATFEVAGDHISPASGN